MTIPNISQKAFDEIFRKFSKNAFVFPKGSKSKQNNFDPYRNTGYVKAFQNALPVKYISKAVGANSLILREIGLTEAGALQLIVQESDVCLFKASRKVEIDGEIYYAFSEAVGNRFQVFKSQFSGYSRIILFRNDNKRDK